MQTVTIQNKDIEWDRTELLKDIIFQNKSFKKQLFNKYFPNITSNLDEWILILPIGSDINTAMHDWIYIDKYVNIPTAVNLKQIQGAGLNASNATNHN